VIIRGDFYTRNDTTVFPARNTRAQLRDLEEEYRLQPAGQGARFVYAETFSFFTRTFEFRPLWSYFSRRPGGRSSGVPSAKPAFDWK